MTHSVAPDTFAHLWAHNVATHPQETFLVFEGPGGHVAEWTYGGFDRVVGRMASYLVDAGLHPAAPVHLALTNSPAFVALWLATIRLGAWIVPSDPMATEGELADHLMRTAPVIGFCATERSKPYRAAAPPSMRVVELTEDDVGFAWLPDREFADWPDLDPSDLAAVMFTSGTTGQPKGVLITQANYAFAGHTMAMAAALVPDDRQLVVLPLFHANAQYYSFAAAITAGASVALIHTFSASGFLAQAARHQATCASLFAAPMRMILARGAPTDEVILRHCWFAQNLTADQYETISTWFGCRPRQLYGMTETIPAVLTDEADAPSPDVMGRVTPGCVVELHDADGQRVPPGEVGEIVVGGTPGTTLFSGYLDDPEITAASFRDGWFVTGDRAWVDDRGRFHFDGRRSDVLKVAGENVSTVEVEAVLSEHPAVLEASVVGAPDPIRDEVPVAYVVAVDPANPPDVADLERWCADRLAKAKRPTVITVIDELPRTSVGKIRKHVLRQEAS